MALALTVACFPARQAAARSAGARAAQGASIASAQRAIRELRYEDARSALDATIKRGHHSRKELIALYALRAEVAAVVDGPGVGESEFRRLLALAPDRAPPRNTPVFTIPFAQARRWIATHGHLEVEPKLPEALRADASTPIPVAVISDPFAMVAGARLFYRQHGEASFVATSGSSLRPALPSIAPGRSIDYYLEVVDAAENVVTQFGSADQPLSVDGHDVPAPPASAPPPPPLRIATPAPRAATAMELALPMPAPPRSVRSQRIAGGIIGGIGLGALAAAIGVDVTGRQQYDSLASSCAPTCGQSSVDGVRTSQDAAIGLYAVAGAAISTSLVLFCVDHFRHAK